MYLRIDNKNFGFVTEKIHEILPTDIKISDEDYKRYFDLLAEGKRISLKIKPETNKGLFGYLEVKEDDKKVVASGQDKLNAQFLKEEAELKKEVQEQKTLNAQVLKEIAKLKQGGAV